MTKHLFMTAAGVFLGALMTTPAAGAQTRQAGGDVCITIDAAHDTFSPQDRTAALLADGRAPRPAWMICPRSTARWSARS
jgi:hypothetical protein